MHCCYVYSTRGSQACAQSCQSDICSDNECTHIPACTSMCTYPHPSTYIYACSYRPGHLYASSMHTGMHVCQHATPLPVTYTCMHTCTCIPHTYTPTHTSRQVSPAGAGALSSKLTVGALSWSFLFYCFTGPRNKQSPDLGGSLIAAHFGGSCETAAEAEENMRKELLYF